jgi:outer membrane beta-barrel protein
MKNLILITILACSSHTFANTKERIDSLGGNKDLMKRARALDAKNKIQIVQKRAVDRNMRLEVGFSYGMFSGGGDPYLNTSAMGASADLHITPRFSVGARYHDHRNELNNEGRRVFEQAQRNSMFDSNFVRPAVDFPDSTTLGVVSFYPFYGKMNMMDMGVTQFDVYVLGGYGQMKLASGSSGTWTAGGGIGLWLAQHFSSRLEVRYQGFQDQIYSGTRDQGVVVSTFSIGFIL